ncbi:TPA: BMP family ABC transporter substrate-binding protein [Pseudomonas aeruginosa]
MFAAVPIPEVIRNINSFTLGAQSVNPKITTKVVWINEWFNPPKETDAANSLINSGADVLMQDTASAAVPQAAEQRGKRAFGVYSDMAAYESRSVAFHRRDAFGDHGMLQRGQGESWLRLFDHAGASHDRSSPMTEPLQAATTIRARAAA